MPFLRAVTKGRWLTEVSRGSNEAPGDCLRDLATDKNALSIWFVDEDISPNEVAAGLVLTREFVSQFDYVLFDDQLIESTGGSLNNVEGNTPLTSVNVRHLDLVGMSANKLSKLAEELFRQGLKLGAPGTNVHRVSVKDIEEILRLQISSGSVKQALINEKMKESLRKKGIL